MILCAYVRTDFYTMEEMEFQWLRSGVKLDDEVTKLLAGYDFTISPVNDTRCYCDKCIPRECQASPAVTRYRIYVCYMAVDEVKNSYDTVGLGRP